MCAPAIPAIIGMGAGAGAAGTGAAPALAAGLGGAAAGLGMHLINKTKKVDELGETVKEPDKAEDITMPTQDGPLPQATATAPKITPVISPTEISSQATERTTRIKRLRAGFASTIKTSPMGITGKQADLMSPSLTGKTYLGS